MRLFEDIICILILLIIPDFLLGKLGLYDSIEMIRKLKVRSAMMGILKDTIYECKKEFELTNWDDDNDCWSDEIIKVEKGSIWNCTGTGYICDGEIRLENDDDATWIEISKATLKEHFFDITKDNSEMATDEYLRSGY